MLAEMGTRTIRLDDMDLYADTEAVPTLIRVALKNAGFDWNLPVTSYRDEQLGQTVFVQRYPLPVGLQPGASEEESECPNGL